jgi:hypothetical protein
VIFQEVTACGARDGHQGGLEEKAETVHSRRLLHLRWGIFGRFLPKF